MVALKTPSLIDAARAARQFSSELGHPVKVIRLESKHRHSWAVLAPDRAALEVFFHILPYLALEVWPHSQEDCR